MLFDGLPADSSCEWRGLIPFVDAYNRHHGTTYTRDTCVDVEVRDRPAPEVLLTSPGEPRIVIERKTIAWPQREHLAHQQKELRFVERFVRAVTPGGRPLGDSVYRLAVGEESLKERNMREVESAAESIGFAVASRLGDETSQGGFAGTEPFDWNFGPLPVWERDETTPASGIGVMVRGQDPLDDASAFLRQREVTLAGYHEEFRRAARAAGGKFADYADCRRLFLVQFFGEMRCGPTDDEIEGIVASASIPENIDQVWVADRRWTSAASYEVEWQHLR